MRLPELSARLALCAIAAGLLLAGCETADNAATSGETGAAGGPPPPPPPPVPFDSGDDYTPLPYNGMAALPPDGEDPLPLVNDNPLQLMGMDRESLTVMLGKPALVRRDGEAEVWQYRADRCVLDLFLYGVEKKVEHVDLRDRGEGNAASVRDCFVGMLRSATPST